MKKIDRETVQRIIDAADIVDVVSDFVNLRRRGANYIGLCPFHSERTPSFSVSRAKGICKCFSCGKGGSPVHFIMELEQMTYQEALRYLARKYNIEIKEHEVSDAEREAMNQRQSMMEANEFAMKIFEQNLTDTQDGRDIGLSYFLDRGLNEWAINRFHLGYALEGRDDFAKQAVKAGIQEKFLVDTGLCYRRNNGTLRDRFYGRMIFPIFTISGKVVAFGGRTLRKEKDVAKYVNSPESIIYSKSRELYGMYQAKQAIVKKEKCILVEGYMDVISMAQKGVENVVASSGTSLTQGQVRLIHRFTERVTVIYDSDPAGIKASLRGIDLLLAEGLDIKVLLLPDGDDPDSFAQSHTTEEIEEYIEQNEVDFIRFKTNILLKDAANDPVKRSQVLGNILMSVARIPNEITRKFYIEELARTFSIDEKILYRQLNVDVKKLSEEDAKQAARNKAIESISGVADAKPEDIASGQSPSGKDTAPQDIQISPELVDAGSLKAKILEPQERMLLTIAIRMGFVKLDPEFGVDEYGNPMLALDYIVEDLEIDGIELTNPLYTRALKELTAIRRQSWDADLRAAMARAEADYNRTVGEGRAEIQRTANNMQEIAQAEAQLIRHATDAMQASISDFEEQYALRALLSHPDDDIRMLASLLGIDKHSLSKIYFKSAHIETDVERINQLVTRALLTLKYDIARYMAEEIRLQIQSLQNAGDDYDLDKILDLMKEQKKWMDTCRQLAPHIGERVYEPLR